MKIKTQKQKLRSCVLPKSVSTPELLWCCICLHLSCLLLRSKGLSHSYALERKKGQQWFANFANLFGRLTVALQDHLMLHVPSLPQKVTVGPERMQNMRQRPKMLCFDAQNPETPQDLATPWEGRLQWLLREKNSDI